MKDNRTTVMIKNIPNKYDLKTLVEELDLNFRGKYDFLYLPIDFENNCNLGYAFLNFIEPLHILLIWELYEAKRWRKFKSVKACHLSYAKFQGKFKLIAHFEKGTIINKMEADKRPLILNVTEPYPSVVIPDRYENYFRTYYLSSIHRFSFVRTEDLQ